MNVKIDDKVLYSFAASDAVLWKEQAADELLRDQDGAQGKQLQAVQKNFLSPVHLIDMCTQCIILQTASAVSLHSSCLVSPQDCTQTKAGKGSHQRSRLNWDSKLCLSYSNTYLHFRQHVRAKPTSWHAPIHAADTHWPLLVSRSCHLFNYRSNPSMFNFMAVCFGPHIDVYLALMHEMTGMIRSYTTQQKQWKRLWRDDFPRCLKVELHLTRKTWTRSIKCGHTKGVHIIKLS